jgi:hypothetical protein
LTKENIQGLEMHPHLESLLLLPLLLLLLMLLPLLL